MQKSTIEGFGYDLWSSNARGNLARSKRHNRSMVTLRALLLRQAEQVVDNLKE
jgi:hypothetical protein